MQIEIASHYALSRAQSDWQSAYLSSPITQLRMACTSHPQGTSSVWKAPCCSNRDAGDRAGEPGVNTILSINCPKGGLRPLPLVLHATCHPSTRDARHRRAKRRHELRPMRIALLALRAAVEMGREELFLARQKVVPGRKSLQDIFRQVEGVWLPVHYVHLIGRFPTRRDMMLPQECSQ